MAPQLRATWINRAWRARRHRGSATSYHLGPSNVMSEYTAWRDHFVPLGSMEPDERECSVTTPLHNTWTHVAIWARKQRSKTTLCHLYT